MPRSATVSDAALAEFFEEYEEIATRIFSHLTHIEKGNASEGTVDALYRDVHTIKGSAHLFGFPHMGRVAHAMETRLEPVRKRREKLDGEGMEALKEALDLLEAIVHSLKGNQDRDFARNIEEVTARLQGKPDPSRLEVRPETGAAAPGQSPADSAPHPPAGEEGAFSDPAATVRVPVGLLDRLMVLMGEMVLVRNQVLQLANREEDLEFLNLSQRLDVLTGELQAEVMKTRMQPIRNILTKFQRVVHDLGRDLGKRIELTLSGTETELDKTLLEAIKDPLMHIIRNACDHGLESPADRAAAGKPETGTIALRAYHEGGQVIVEIADDGRGLDREKIVSKAVAKGLVSREKGLTLSEREIFGLIFLPGFSTADQVTNLSGRGVGMDIVKSNVERVGGFVELGSAPGRGTTFRLKIPLTLAIVPTLVVRCGDHRYAIPQVKVVELIRIEKQASQGLETLEGRPMFRLRDTLLPVLELRSLLGLGETDPQAAEVLHAVVLNAEGRLFGLLVDEIQDTADVVVKPLSRFLKSLQVFSGATVLGDGSVALILDISGIAQRAELQQRTIDPVTGAGAIRGRGADDQEFLLFRLNSGARHAIPLGLVQRLEEFSPSDVQVSGNQRVISYRGTILPLVRLEPYLGYPVPPEDGKREIPVIVLQKADRLFGLEVTEILDILTTDEELDEFALTSPGIAGNLVVGDEVVVVVDALRFLTDCWERLSRNQALPTAENLSHVEGRRGKRILFVEDTAFFRRRVTKVLTAAGYEVVTAVNGQDALDRLEQEGAERFSLILSDIEMPVMNGLELARALRRRYGHIPLVAFTSRFGEKDVKAGREAGFNYYVEKSDETGLLREIDRLIFEGPGETKREETHA